MNFRKWLSIYISAIILTCAVIAGFNALIDPFGIFGDRLIDWYAYNMTQNPRAAKIGYLDMHFRDYDSYIIGCSKTGSFSTAALNRYYGGANFYNMLMYGGDMYDIEKTANYLVNNYNVNNIIINMGLEETVRYNTEADDMKTGLHAKVDGSSKLLYYGKHLSANPVYAFKKIIALFTDSYLVNENDVFIPKTGAYDKSVRDVEPIGSIDEYLLDYPSFRTVLKKKSLDAVDSCIGSIERIKKLCDQKGKTFMLIISPIYHTEMDVYDRRQLEAFHRKLSQVTGYWDFSGYNYISYEPRYFYDPYHFRNVVGDMALARIFGGEGLYIPDDFGWYVTKDNVEVHLKNYFAAEKTGYFSKNRGAADAAKIPILMYHHLAGQPAGNTTITPGTFEEQIAALKNAGYDAIFFSQLADYVYKGAELPDKPLLITFDDGYRSNYETAFPILKKYGMAATINVIGSTVGANVYNGTGAAIKPHFSYEEALEMTGSGLIDIQSHSYDLHSNGKPGKNGRKGVFINAGGSEEEFIDAFLSDLERSRSEIEENTGCDVMVYAYPNGYHTDLTEVLLREMGMKVTLTVEEGVNTVVKGLPQSLMSMKRFRIREDISGQDLIEMLKG